MAHEVETMAYAGAVPWHGLGNGVGDAQTSEVMIVEAGLDWLVKTGPIYGPDRKKIDGFERIFRDSDNKTFAVSRGSFEPVQNAEAFAFTDGLIKDGVARYEAAGSLMGGRKVWVLMKMEQDWSIGDEAFHNYVLFQNGHDLDTAIIVKYVNERVICHNTLQMALGERGLTFRTTHHAGVKRRLEIAQEVFQVTTATQKRLKALLEKAQAVKLGETEKDAIMTGIFGTLDEATAPQRKHVIETFQAIYAAEQALNGDTAYTMLNAATGYADHGAQFRGEAGSQERQENRMKSMIGGSAQMFKTKALQVVTTVLPELKALA